MTITSHALAPRTRAVSIGSAGALLAAIGFGVEGAITLFHHTGDNHWDALSQVLNAAYAVAVLGLVVALPAVGSWLGVGRIGRVAIAGAQVGYLAMALESVVSGLHDGNTLGGLFFGGLVLTMVGLLVLGTNALFVGRHRSFALLPFLGMVIGVLGGEHGGGIVTGIVWAGFAALYARSND